MVYFRGFSGGWGVGGFRFLLGVITTVGSKRNGSLVCSRFEGMCLAKYDPIACLY